MCAPPGATLQMSSLWADTFWMVSQRRSQQRAHSYNTWGGNVETITILTQDVASIAIHLHSQSVILLIPLLNMSHCVCLCCCCEHITAQPLQIHQLLPPLPPDSELHGGFALLVMSALSNLSRYGSQIIPKESNHSIFFWGGVIPFNL